MSRLEVLGRRVARALDLPGRHGRLRGRAPSENAEWPLLYAAARQVPQWPAGASPSPAVAVSSAARKPWAALLGALLLAALAWYAGSDWVWGRLLQKSAAPHEGPAAIADETAQVAGSRPEYLATESDPASSLRAAAWNAESLDDAPGGLPAYIGVPLKQVEPVYPQAARNAGIEGLVIVTYTLDAEGRASDLHVAKSVPMLDEAVLSALRKWEYPPVPRGVTPPNYRYNVEFVLDDWRR